MAQKISGAAYPLSALRALVKALGYVQVDTLKVVNRAHDIMLWARFGVYALEDFPGLGKSCCAVCSVAGSQESQNLWFSGLKILTRRRGETETRRAKDALLDSDGALRLRGIAEVRNAPSLRVPAHMLKPCDRRLAIAVDSAQWGYNKPSSVLHPAQAQQG